VATSNQGIPIPGGLVRQDINRGQPAAFGWVRAFLEALGDGTGLRRRRDIVIYEAETMREVYRVGPYNGRTITRPMRRLVSQINQVGLDQFLRAEQIEDGKVGPIRRSSGQMSIERLSLEWRAWVSVTLHRLWRR
jgi:hypothetical protein